jgi:hypothetical protein
MKNVPEVSKLSLNQETLRHLTHTDDNSFFELTPDIKTLPLSVCLGCPA